MKKPVATVIGTLDDQGRAKPFPGVKVAGEGSRYLDCPACGQRLDKSDLADVLFHEERCPGKRG